MVSAEGILVDLGRRSSRFFHAEEALDNVYLPARESFVVRHRIRSMVGIGELLPSGELFVVLMFSKVWITRETAVIVHTFTLSVKLILLSFSGVRIFSTM